MDNQILIRVDKGLKKELELASMLAGLSISEFVRRAVLREISRQCVIEEKKRNNKEK